VHHQRRVENQQNKGEKIMTISNEPKFGESFVCLVCGKHYPIGEIVIKELEDIWVDRKDGINVLCFLCYVEGIINSGNAKILPDSVKEEYFKGRN